MAPVVIVGGGPAGAATAISLARSGVSSVVLEASPGPRWKVGESLPPSANPVLEQLGLTAGVQRAGCPSFGNRSIWGSAQPVERDFVFGTAGTGWRIDRESFEAELASAAIEAGASWRYASRLVGCARRKPRGWLLSVATGDGVQSYEADVVVDASGRPARLARLLGVPRVRHDRLIATVTYPSVAPVPAQSDRDSTVLVEAAAAGWWYSLFLPGNRLALAYLTDGDLDSGRLRDQDGLSTLLEDAPETRSRWLGAGTHTTGPALAAPTGVPLLRPAHTSRLAQVVGQDWLAVGEAALTFDPLASYGIAAALGAGCCAAAAVAGHLDGQPEALSDYARLMDSTFARFLVLQHDRYSVEQRWSDEVFWRRRHHVAPR